MEETNISQEQNPLGTAPVRWFDREICNSGYYQHAGQCFVQYSGPDFYWPGRGDAGKCGYKCCISCNNYCNGVGTASGEIGGASNYNLEIGRRKREEGKLYSWNGAFHTGDYRGDSGSCSTSVFASASKLIWCNDRCYALCGGLSWDHSCGTSFLCIIHWRQS